MVTRSISPSSSSQEPPAQRRRLNSNTQDATAPKSPLEELAKCKSAFVNLCKFLPTTQFACMRAVSQTLSLHTYSVIPNVGLEFVNNAIAKANQLSIFSIPNAKAKATAEKLKNTYLKKLQNVATELEALKSQNNPLDDDNLITLSIEPADLPFLPRLDQLERELNSLIDFTRALNHLGELVASLTTHYNKQMVNRQNSERNNPLDTAIFDTYNGRGIAPERVKAAYGFIHDHITYKNFKNEMFFIDAYRNLASEIQTTYPALTDQDRSQLYCFIALHTGISLEDKLQDILVLHEDDGFKNSLTWEAVLSVNQDMIVPLLECGVNPDAIHSDNSYFAWSLLDLEAREEMLGLELAETLIEYGADVNIGMENYPPLQNALRMGNIEMVELLIKHGARLDFPPAGLETAREMINKNEDPEVRQRLFSIVGMEP